MILLDTQTLLWYATDHRLLGRRSRSIIMQAWRDHEAAVSAFSFWELMMNRDARDVRPLGDISAWQDGLLRDGLVEVPVNGRIAIRAAGLTGLHGDPGDRIIVATALDTDLLITSDELILDWREDYLSRFSAYR